MKEYDVQTIGQLPMKIDFLSSTRYLNKLPDAKAEQIIPELRLCLFMECFVKRYKSVLFSELERMPIDIDAALDKLVVPKNS